MDMTSIAATGMAMKQAKLQQDVHFSLMSKVMETQEQAALQLISELEAANPTSGGTVDVYA